MTNEQPIIDVFSKATCGYCDRAKALLREGGLSWREHDVVAVPRNANASVYFSGSAKVPQIFIGGYPVNGAEDLQRLRESGHLDALLAFGRGRPALPLDQTNDADLADGAEDLVARTVIPKSDGARDDDPEAWPLLRFYKEFFGFWPNTFAYLHHWPEAYKLFVYAHNFEAVGAGRQVLGDSLMLAVAFGTSEAQGCTYCQSHSAAFAGEKSARVVRAVQCALDGQAGPDHPIGPYEESLVRLAAHAALGPVSEKSLRVPYEKASEARGGPRDPDADIEATALVASAFGFLNVFNDLVGMQVEGDWARTASSVGIEPGRHGAEEGNPDNLSYAIPSGGPTMEDMLAKYDVMVGELEPYQAREFGLAPAWINAMPPGLRRRHTCLYGELMGDRPHSTIPAEHKHLIARVSAIAKGHANLAAVEAYMAHHTATNKERALRRIETCYSVATGRLDGRSHFSERERAALVVAWLSAQTPLITPRRFLRPAVATHDAKALIELFAVCGVASLVQRLFALRPQPLESDVAAFLDAHGLERDPLMLRYPLPIAGGM